MVFSTSAFGRKIVRSEISLPKSARSHCYQMDFPVSELTSECKKWKKGSVPFVSAINIRYVVPISSSSSTIITAIFQLEWVLKRWSLILECQRWFYPMTLLNRLRRKNDGNYISFVCFSVTNVTDITFDYRDLKWKQVSIQNWYGYDLLYFANYGGLNWIPTPLTETEIVNEDWLSHSSLLVQPIL